MRCLNLLHACLLILLSSNVALASTDEALVPRWWNDRVFYEIFIRSFQDSDADGIGDIQGIINRLDYLNDGDRSTENDLGVTGIWLMPPMEAHSYHGYDVTDYYAVEQNYGTVDDMRQLVSAAHDRGIAVIVDLVLNHTSSRHPWFIASRNGDPDYADWYIWRDEHPGYAGPWGAPAWHATGGRYYYGVFWDGMPDLNLRNRALSFELYAVADFWLNDIGVDGFRLDAIKHLIENGRRQENQPESRAWLRELQTLIDASKPNMLAVGEIFGAAPFIAARYINESAIDIAFDFTLADKMISAAQRGNNRDIARAHQIALREYPPNQFAAFLTNHDQDRLFDRVLHDVGKNKVAASLLLTGPGVPFLYYGEEIGMAGTKPDPRLRTPMQWTNSPNGGFTDAAAPWQPLQAEANLAFANVADQTDDPASLLSHYRDLIHLRNSHSALRQGAMTLVDSATREVYAFLRHDDQETLLVLINLSDEAATGIRLNLDSSELLFGTVALVYGAGAIKAPQINQEGGFADYQPLDGLPPHGFAIISF